MTRLPRELTDVRYEGSRIPGATHDLAEGANCQRYAYAVLAHFGQVVPPWRPSELWADETVTQRVDAPFAPLDLLLFSPAGAAWGAHVGVWWGEQGVLHLCRAVGRPTVWSLDQFSDLEEYHVLLGGKRVRV